MGAENLFSLKTVKYPHPFQFLLLVTLNQIVSNW